MDLYLTGHETFSPGITNILLILGLGKDTPALIVYIQGAWGIRPLPFNTPV